MTYDPMMLLDAYRRMRSIREFEERMRREVQAGTVPGFVHLYCGEEAIAVGACIHLNDGDYIGSTHRGHGHCIAKGCDIGDMLLEIYCKQGGLCNGKGGSMHIADLRKGMLGANAIVGAAPPIAVGAALTDATLGNGRRRTGVHRRRRLEPGHGLRGVEFLVDPEAADDLHVREQRLCRVHGHQVSLRRRRYCRSRGRFRHARQESRRRGFLRRVRRDGSSRRACAPRRGPEGDRSGRDALVWAFRGRHADVSRSKEVEGLREVRSDPLFTFDERVTRSSTSPRELARSMTKSPS